jgi:hypothetical protein
LSWSPCHARVARWHDFKPKIPIWLNFGGSCKGKSWHILRPLGIVCGYLVYFAAIRYILRFLVKKIPILACFTKKNLATLCHTHRVFMICVVFDTWMDCPKICRSTGKAERFCSSWMGLVRNGHRLQSSTMNNCAKLLIQGTGATLRFSLWLFCQHKAPSGTQFRSENVSVRKFLELFKNRLKTF